MPRMDGTGPTGAGRGTGRGMGPCGKPGVERSQSTPSQSSGWLMALLGLLGSCINRGSGRGQGRGRRR